MALHSRTTLAALRRDQPIGFEEPESSHGRGAKGEDSSRSTTGRAPPGRGSAAAAGPTCGRRCVVPRSGTCCSFGFVCRSDLSITSMVPSGGIRSPGQSSCVSVLFTRPRSTFSDLSVSRYFLFFFSRARRVLAREIALGRGDTHETRPRTQRGRAAAAFRVLNVRMRLSGHCIFRYSCITSTLMLQTCRGRPPPQISRVHTCIQYFMRTSHLFFPTHVRKLLPAEGRCRSARRGSTRRRATMDRPSIGRTGANPR